MASDEQLRRLLGERFHDFEAEPSPKLEEVILSNVAPSAGRWPNRRLAVLLLLAGLLTVFTTWYFWPYAPSVQRRTRPKTANTEKGKPKQRETPTEAGSRSGQGKPGVHTPRLSTNQLIASATPATTPPAAPTGHVPLASPLTNHEPATPALPRKETLTRRKTGSDAVTARRTRPSTRRAQPVRYPVPPWHTNVSGTEKVRQEAATDVVAGSRSESLPSGSPATPSLLAAHSGLIWPAWHLKTDLSYVPTPASSPAITREALQTRPARLHWSVGLGPMLTYQQATVVNRVESRVQAISPYPAFRAQRLGGHIFGQVMRPINQRVSVSAGLSYSVVPRWDHFEEHTGSYLVTYHDSVATTAAIVRSVDQLRYDQRLSLRLTGWWALNRQSARPSPAIGGGIDWQYRLHDGQKSVVLLGVYSHPLALGKRVFRAEPFFQYSLSALTTPSEQLLVHPYQLGISLRTEISRP